MALFKRDSDTTNFTAVESNIRKALELNQYGIQEDAVKSLLVPSLESISETERNVGEMAEDSAEKLLKECGFTDLLLKHVGGNENDVRYRNGMDAANAMVIAAMNAPSYHETFRAKKSTAPDGVKMMRSVFDAPDVSLEGYDALDFKAFLAQSIIAAGLSAAGSPLSEAWFRTVVLTAGQNGVDVHLIDPRVFQRTARKTNGGEYTPNYQSIVRSLIDPTILQDKHTAIVPVSDAAFEPSLFVPAAKVPNATVTVMGVETTTRPYAYGKHIDLIRTSTPPTAVNGANLDHTDTLDAAINMGTQYVELTNTAGTPVSGVVAIDVAPLRGALLNPQDEGNEHDLSANFRQRILIASDTPVVGGGTFESKFAFAATLGLQPTDLYYLEVELYLTASANRINATMRMDMGGFTITNAYKTAAKTPAIAPELAAAQAWLGAYAGLGFVPGATKSDTNMRENGYMLNMTDAIKARIPAIMQSPVSIVSPVSGPASATMDGVAMYRRALSSNIAIGAIITGAARLKSSAGIVDGSPAIGAIAGILPTYVTRAVDTTAAINQFGSTNSLNDLEGLLTANLTVLATEMLTKSGYLASLELYTGTTQGNWELIIATSPAIATFLTKTADKRTFGQNVNFNIQTSNDNRLIDKIYMSVRRTDVSGADAHSFGVHPMMPSFIHRATVSRGTTSSETIVVPCENFAMMCPIIAEMDVNNLSNLFLG